MDAKYIIDIFCPPKYDTKLLTKYNLCELFGREMRYASKGRHALYHILKSLNVKDKILLPAYMCESVLNPIKKLNICPFFYDMDYKDLNPSIESIISISKKYNIKCVLVPSMYGMPANLKNIQEYCKSKSIILIDDAAQSFGAELDGQLIGTFGQAGFFSFSPGKPTAGHMGAYYWTKNKEYDYKKSNHMYIHYLSYINFYFNRLNIYKYSNLKIFKNLDYLERFIQSRTNIINDNVAKFELKILEGIINANLDDKFLFRQKFMKKFIDIFSNNEYFNIVKSIRGKPNYHKFVILAQNTRIRNKLAKHLLKNKIYCSKGYKLLTNRLDYISNSVLISKCILELPIENSEKKMEYLFDILLDFNI